MDKYKIEKNKITVLNPNNFNIKKTLECGQVFRYKNKGNSYEIYSKNHMARLENVKNDIIIHCDDEIYFKNYFDLNTDYDIINHNLREQGLLPDAIRFGNGIRILKQDPFETLISFIISANNHIPRIKKIIETLCTKLGEDCGSFYAFPKAEVLAQHNAEFYRDCGLGYRAEYVAKTAKIIANGFDLQAIYDMSSDIAGEKLLTLSGVGAKVADCILLFAYHKLDVFPVDTWIKKVYNCYFEIENNPRKIREALIRKFGNLSGYAQQYLFYYKREKDKKD